MPSINPTLQRIFADRGVRLVEEGDWLTTGGRYRVLRNDEPAQGG